VQELYLPALAGKKCREGLQMSFLLPVFIAKDDNELPERAFLGDLGDIILKCLAIDALLDKSFARRGE
jgi:hypothetical protein